MLEISILKSDDSDSIGNFKFPLISIEIGTSINSTLRIYDNSVLTPVQIKIVNYNKVLVIYNGKNGFIHNNKKSKISAIASENDVLKFRKLEIKILKIAPPNTMPIDLKTRKREIITELQQKKPGLIKVLEAIEEDLINLGG